VISGLAATGVTAISDSFDLHDTMTRLQTNTFSDHTLIFGTNNGLTTNGSTLVITFLGFDLTGLTSSDISLDDGTGLKTLGASAGASIWGVSFDNTAKTITLTAPTSGSTAYVHAVSNLTIKIGLVAGGASQMMNPSGPGSAMESILLTNGANIEVGQVAIPIVDSDQVNVTSYINTFVNFDIDTNTTNGDCTYNTCPVYGGSAGNASNYTVDLGELNSSYVNRSQDATVVHSDGVTGAINSIYFDLTTNAFGGAIVLVKSTNGALVGPDTNTIPAITDGLEVVANSKTYGFTMPTGDTGNGTIVTNTSCSAINAFCGLTTEQKEVFNTNGAPLDVGRVRMDLAAAAAYVNNPGTYTDTLTFIAVPTF
jgi:hypothetical protein